MFYMRNRKFKVAGFLLYNIWHSVLLKNENFEIGSFSKIMVNFDYDSSTPGLATSTRLLLSYTVATSLGVEPIQRK